MLAYRLKSQNILTVHTKARRAIAIKMKRLDKDSVAVRTRAIVLVVSQNTSYGGGAGKG